MREMTHAGLLFGAAILCSAQAFAQVPPAADPGAIQQRMMDDLMRRQELERERRKPVAEPLRRDVPEPAAAQPGPEAVRFMVREIRFSKSEILSADELDAVARDFRGRELSLADLQQLAARINELYKSKGVVTAQAIVPPQDVSSGVVTIRLVEGRLGKLHIKGNESTNESYVADRVGLKPHDLMDLAALEAALVRFNRTNDAQLRVELAPGERFATTDLSVLMTEPPRHDMRLTFDNLGSAPTGKERTGLSYLNRSLLGFRDDLSLSATQATGQFSQSVSYGFPFNPWGGRVNLGYYKDKTAIRNGLLATLKITGESAARVVSLRQPTIVSNAMQIDVVAGGKTRRSYNWIDNVLLQRTDTEDRNLGVEAQLFDEQSNWFAGYIHYKGDAQITQRENFGIDRGSVRHNRNLSEGLAFRGNLAWQSTKQVLLPSSEQFFIGGEGSVRGYPVGVYSGDTGHTLNLELHHPLVAASADTGGLGATGFFFADRGRVKPYRAPNSTLKAYESLTGLGWGANITMGKAAYARVTFGYGVTEVPNQPRNYEITLQFVASVF
jgi:hemolysin activation/secretion protein